MTGDGYGTAGSGHGPVPGGHSHESDILLRQLDGHLAGLRASRHPVDLGLAERMAESLRRLVTETAFASAADRARVRAAVHYFVLRREPRAGERRSGRGQTADVQVVNEIMRALGRHDLAVEQAPGYV